eukprot:gene736-799_t
MTDNSNYWGGWLSAAKDFANKAQEMAESVSKVTQEKALQIVKQAQEIQKNYDLEVATSIFTASQSNHVDSRGEEVIRLTKADLSRLDMTYITENILAMAFPRDMTKPGNYEECNDINVVAAYLKKKHQGRYMIWNISEESYDYRKFADQVLEYRFPGHPAPPLGLLFKICSSVESWLDADDKNVAVVHCLTGKGRTATLIACILTWLGEFDSPMQALQYVAQRRGTMVDYLTIPSQRRYIQYFSNMLDGIRPNSEPLLLRRIILNTIPVFSPLPDNADVQGCCPYIQIFKNGKLIASASAYTDSASTTPVTTGTQSESEKKTHLRWVSATEGSCNFQLDCPMQGDILLRCRHAAVSGARVSMFRAAFHTGYISGGVLRLTKAQLDGSASDPRYGEDFFIDLIFAPITKADSDTPSTDKSTSTDNGLTIDSNLADKYEQSLHKDARFWESITARKLRSKKRKARKFEESQQDQFRIAEDSKFLEDQDSIAEVKFTSTWRTEADEELIKQLALAEKEDHESPAGETAHSTLVPPSPSRSEEQLQTLRDLEQELGLGDMQLFSSEKANPSSTTGSAPAPTTSSNEPGAADDLEELEKYLQSLSTNTSQV